MESLGPLGANGYVHIEWANADIARTLSRVLCSQHRQTWSEVVKNPHLKESWAKGLVQTQALVKAVSKALGSKAAVENSSLVIKWPGRHFEVPWHQDGIGLRPHLDPERSVSAWLAISDARYGMGALRVVRGSHRRGYLPVDWEEDGETGRDRATTVRVPPGTNGNVTLLSTPAGGGYLMDTRLLHGSSSNERDVPCVGLNIRFVASPDGRLLRDRKAR